MAAFLDGLVSHYVFDDGKLVVAHAGMKTEMQGRGSGKVRDFALYGETTGETDEFGLPVRHNWAAEYRGAAMVVYGHTPVPEPEWLNRTVNIDTGCVFGGKLTALRYPEKEFVSVPAAHTYCEATLGTPFARQAVDQQAPRLTAQQLQDDLLDAEDVLGKRIITTRLRGKCNDPRGECDGRAGSDEPLRRQSEVADLPAAHHVAVRDKQCAGPAGTSRRGVRLLSEPGRAAGRSAKKSTWDRGPSWSFAETNKRRKERFGVGEDEIGIVYTRTGRRFFNEPEFERQFVDRVRAALTAADFWATFSTSWACLDCELMPWSAKAQELLRTQYAAVGAAGRASLPCAVAGLELAAARLNGDEKAQLEKLRDEYRRREENLAKFVAAYRQYCWSVSTLTDLKLAPFHLLATEGKVHQDKDHRWHMDELAKICRCDAELQFATPYQIVDVTDPASEANGIDWWTKLTERGGEGMVVKPLDFIHRGKRGLAQPAVKCRGREYLRIIYGPDYSNEENFSRLRNRGLGQKRGACPWRIRPRRGRLRALRATGAAAPHS